MTRPPCWLQTVAPSAERATGAADCSPQPRSDGDNTARSECYNICHQILGKVKPIVAKTKNLFIAALLLLAFIMLMDLISIPVEVNRCTSSGYHITLMWL